MSFASMSVVEETALRSKVWPSARIGDICQVNPPKPKANLLPPESKVTFVPMAAVDDLTGAIIASEEREFSKVRGSYTAFQEGDVIFAKITPCMQNGKCAVANGLSNGLGFGSSEFHVFRPTHRVLAEYLYHYLRQPSFRKEAEEHMTGSVGQARISADWMKDYEIPLPPIDEQRRIIALIEEVQCLTQPARERLETVRTFLKKFRQSVLAAAYEGSLNEEIQADWPKAVLLGSVLASIEAGKSFKAEGFPARAGMPGVIKVSAMTWGKFDPTENKQLLSGTMPNPRTAIQAGDLLFSRANTEELVGATVIVTESPGNLYLSDKSLRLMPKSQISSDWLNIVLSSPQVRSYFREVATGTSNSMRNISQAKLLQTPIPIPDYTSQQLLVTHVESLLSMVNELCLNVQLVENRISGLMSTLLSHALVDESRNY